MSLQFLHESILKAIEVEAVRLANQAIGMRAAVGLPADQYAMVQAQTLATAYGLQQAAVIVTRQYKLMTEAPAKQDANDDEPPKQQRPLYG